MKHPLRRTRRSFTLLELMVAFIIMAVLSAVAIPSLIGVVGNDQVTADNTSAVAIADAAYYNGQSEAGQATPAVPFPITAAEATTFVPSGTVVTVTDGTDLSVNGGNPYLIFTFADGGTVFVTAPQTAGDGSPTIVPGGTEGGGGTTTTAPSGPEVVAVIALPAVGGNDASPDGIAVDGGTVWVSDFANNQIDEITGTTPSVQATVTVPGAPAGLAHSGPDLWVGEYGTREITEIDIGGGSPTIVGNTPVDTYPSAVSVVGSDNVWSSDFYANSVYEIDPSTGNILHTTTGLNAPWAIADGHTDVWVANSGNGTVSEIDPTSGDIIHTITVGNDPRGIDVDGNGNVWVSNYGDGTVTEINGATAAVMATVTVGSSPSGVNADGANVWVANTGDNSVSEIDISTAAVIHTVTDPSFNGPTAISSNRDGTTVWVTNASGASVTEIQP